MRITLIDDSIPFDGHSPAAQPLGGAEKAFAGLASALAKRGHEVQVFNRCAFPVTVEGAAWRGWESARPPETDVLIAYRKPQLLDEVPEAKTRILWLAAPAQYLNRPAAQAILDRTRPVLVFQGHRHKETFSGWRAFREAVIAPGVRPDYLDELPMEYVDPPRAVVTTHPQQGLDWLLVQWMERIRPQNPRAELHVYSAVLDRAMLGGEVPEAVRPVYNLLRTMDRLGVRVHRPLADPGMAQAYRSARVHLYPGAEADMLCSTLMESQATGLPAVVRPLGAARERVRDGQTAFVVPDAAAFANTTLRLLGDDDLFFAMSRDARTLQRHRPWDVVAAEFEALWR